MDSLLANYASSDEEEDQQEPPPPPRTAAETKSTAKSLFSSIPPSKPSSSGLFSLPPPKSRLPKPPVIGFLNDGDEVGSMFSVLPKPKTSSSFPSPLPQPPPKARNAGPVHPSPAAAKRVIQLRPPLLDASDDEDDEDEEEERKRRKKQEATKRSSSSGLGNISAIPVPKNSATLGTSSLGSGTSRRSIIDADVPRLKNSSTESAAVAVVDQGFVSSAVVDQGSLSSSGGASENYAGYGSDYSNWAPGADENYGDYASYGGDHGNYATYGQYQSNQIEEPTVSLGPEISGMGGSRGFQIPGKRGRNQMPVEMVEVKQDELMKDRPREDQAKVTGIAFGPSYMPASTKGKPNKLHKRKHQIGTLYHDMKSKEMELAERRAKGLLTKAQTQGKYGW